MRHFVDGHKVMFGGLIYGESPRILESRLCVYNQYTSSDFHHPYACTPFNVEIRCAIAGCSRVTTALPAIILDFKNINGARTRTRIFRANHCKFLNRFLTLTSKSEEIWNCFRPRNPKFSNTFFSIHYDIGG